jgi:acetyl-CoA carboxylase/biotin carboxylase 1
MPQKLEEDIRVAINLAKAKSDVQEFPAVRIKKVLEHYVQDHVLPADRTVFRTSLGALYDALDKFSGGLKVHKMNVIANLLERYSATESLFGGSIEVRVLALRDQYKDDLDQAVNLVLSHIKVQSKAKLVLAVLDYVKTSGIPVSNPESQIFKVLNALASLEAKYVLFAHSSFI